MKLKQFLIACAGLLPVIGLGQDQPNIVVMLMDDMGWNDIGAYTYPSKATPGPPPASVSGGAGTIDVPPPNPAYDGGAPSLSITPRIDSLADDGVRLTQFYATHPVCTPTRASLMTGSYATRVRLENVVGPYSDANRGDRGLNSTEVTLPELLRAAGYRTGMSGKWHLGHDTDFNPRRHGFESYFGILYSNDMWEPNTAQPWGPLQVMDGETALSSYVTDTGYTITNQIDTDAEQSYLLEAMTDEAVDFIDGAVAEGRPFFLYYAPHTPHVPIHPHPDYLSVAGQTDPVARYYDLIEEIDARVGEILDRLAFHGVENDTIVIFTSDNGPSQHTGRVQAGEVPGGCGSAYPFRGRKSLTQEGGHRVPFLARYSGMIPAGTVRDQAGVTFDLYTTLANLAGALLPADRTIDGADLWPVLSGASSAEPHSTFYFYDSGQTNAEAVIDLSTEDKWKYTEIDGLPGDLFRIGDGFTEDFQESFDVAGANPSLQSSLDSQLASWNNGVIRRETGWVRGIRIEVEDDTVTVDENGTATTRIRLSGSTTKTIRVARFSGDSSLNVAGGSTISFDSSNWDTWQTVTFEFSPDLDTEDGTAVFRVYGDSISSSSDIHVREIFVYENDLVQQVTQIPPPDNALLLRYPLDESGGMTVADVSENNNTGTIKTSSGFAWEAGRLNGGLHFDGSTQTYIDSASSIAATDTTGLSACAWINLGEFGSTENRWILQQFDGSGTGRTWLAVKPDGSLQSFVGGSETAGGSIGLDQWHHVAVTTGNNMVSLYVDGLQVASNSFTIENNTAGFRIANHKNLEISRQWIGLLDDIRLYTGTLSSDEIRWLADRRTADLQIQLSLQEDNGMKKWIFSYQQLSGGSGTPGVDYTVDGTTWSIETSSNVSSNWETDAAIFSLKETPVAVDPYSEIISIQVELPDLSNPRRFVRLKVMDQ